MRKWLISTLALILVFSGLVTEKSEASSTFHDVAQTFWAVNEIEEMERAGIISGYEGNVFKPDNPVSREEFAALLAKTFYLNPSASTPTFTDVTADSWSYAAIESAKDYLPGYSTAAGDVYFNPTAPAAREDVAAALVRALGYKYEADPSTFSSKFRDHSDVSPHVLADVARAAIGGLITGYEDGTFRPKATVTRAETAVILYRALYGPTTPPNSKSAVKASPSTLITDFSQATGWYGTVSQTTDPNRVVEGPSSVALFTDDKHTTTGARLQNLALDLSKARNLMLRLYVEDIEKLSKIEVRLSSTSKMSSYMQYPHTRWKLVPGWNEVVIPIDDFTAVGDESFEHIMTTLQVSITQKGDLPVSVVFDALYRDYKGRGRVVIQFDDGWSSVYTKAVPMMNKKGFVGNLGIVSKLVGTKNYSTSAQLKEMYAQGWDIFNHTASHSRLSTLTEEQVALEFSTAKAFLMRHQMTRAADFIAYPYGDYNDTVVNIASRYSRFARTTTPNFEIDSPINPYRLKTIELVNDIAPSDYQEAIRFAAENGTTVIFLLHRIEDTGTDSIILHTDDFQAFLDYLELSRNQVDVLSISQWYGTINQ
ncbi:S-layer homology domain-containing protein [Paenibacillus sp. MBLB4367]|uniref:S-layer homology domain-containing protein n=1 Tax=Paenibacillus sp. MBLB4367 TaxID=3384767 RepID=UPI003907EDE4